MLQTPATETALRTIVTAAAQINIPSDAEIAANISKQLDAYGGASIVVGIITPGGRRIIAHGPVETGGKPADGDTIYDLASVTKAFVALALTDMVRRGEVQLDDPASKYLPPDLKMPVEASGRTVTLRDLADYTSTFPWDVPDRDIDKVRAFLAEFRPPYPIGTRFGYSNLSYGLLAFALARHEGVNVETLLRQHILEPLGMKDTDIINGQQTPARWAGRYAQPYGAKMVAVPHMDHSEYFMGSGGLSGSANDMLTFLEVAIGLKVTALYPAITDLSVPRTPTETQGVFAALGVGVIERDGRSIIAKPGGNEGTNTWIGYDPLRRIGVVVLANASIDTGEIAMNVLLQPRSK